MAEPIRYVVVCTCTGEAEPLAWVDDERPAGGQVTVRSAPNAGQVIIGNRMMDDLPAPTHETVAAAWADSTVSETHWDTGRSGWAINCPHCPDRAQLSDSTLSGIADELVTARDQLPYVPTPDPTDPSMIEQRHFLPLGVLIRRLGSGVG
ncbi:hypothetical protein U8D42_12785 [Mycobacterium europaeum]|uniref:hypothetical protein n=1 Tax=Mycobacterium europaeum TaxID=761804 RepID=UPI002AE08CB6|nr:hypothetical protein [Mycobacterium europaeum]MEA1160658.1 hypothetical protein [Mycobacterium europaeum]